MPLILPHLWLLMKYVVAIATLINLEMQEMSCSYAALLSPTKVFIHNFLVLTSSLQKSASLHY